MPLYTFECQLCKRKRDIKMTISEMEKRKAVFCDKCKGKMKKLVTSANFVIKGFNAKNNYSHEKPSKKKKED